ncbi:MAG: hypothetical protein AB1555_12880 [Nitrospirota bacterium]
MTQPLSDADYLKLGRQLADLLGTSLDGQPAEALRALARSYDPSAGEARINAEVFLFHKYLVVRACIDVLPERHIEGVVGGLFAVLNERAARLDIGQERLAAMEQMWLDRAQEFDPPFSLDRREFLAEPPDALHWQRTLARFCRNVSGTAGPTGSGPSTELLSFEAGNSVTHTLGTLLEALEEISRLHFRDDG